MSTHVPVRFSRLALPLLASAAGAVSASAQRMMVPHDLPRALIALVDVRAGALVDGAWLDVESTAVPPPGNASLRAAERVGDEIWVAGGRWVWRYDAATKALLDSFEMNSLVRSIDAQSRRTIVITSESLSIYDLDGILVRTLAITGASDTLELRDSMLVSVEGANRVQRYTSNGTLLGTFAGPSVPTGFGVLSRPRQLALRRSGNVLVCGDVRVYEFTPDGRFVGEYDVGPFEGGVAETDSGRLFVPLGNGVALYDVETNAATRVGGLFFGQGRRVGVLDSGAREHLRPDDPSSDPLCSGPANSTGLAARAGILGSPIVDESTLTAFGERLPPGAISTLMMSMDPGRLTLSIGTLCLDRGSLGFVPTPQVASASGQVLHEILRGPVQWFPIIAGASWYGQLLYRDGPGARLSSAFRVRFAR